jgi:hypothetical protein
LRFALYLFAAFSLSAKASLLSDIPTDSIDTMYEQCFAQPECAQQINSLIVRYSNINGGNASEIVPTLRNCLANNSSMTRCASFLLFAIDDELANAKENLKLQTGGRCAKKLTAAAEEHAQSKTQYCFDHADDEGSESRLVDMSCRMDFSRSELRYLKDADLCKACRYRSGPNTSVEGAACKLRLHRPSALRAPAAPHVKR